MDNNLFRIRPDDDEPAIVWATAPGATNYVTPEIVSPDFADQILKPLIEQMMGEYLNRDGGSFDIDYSGCYHPDRTNPVVIID